MDLFHIQIGSVFQSAVCVLCRKGMVSCPELFSQLLQTHGAQDHRPLRSPEPGNQERPVRGLSSSISLSKAVGEGWVWGTPVPGKSIRGGACLQF